MASLGPDIQRRITTILYKVFQKLREVNLSQLIL